MLRQVCEGRARSMEVNRITWHCSILLSCICTLQFRLCLIVIMTVTVTPVRVDKCYVLLQEVFGNTSQVYDQLHRALFKFLSCVAVFPHYNGCHLQNLRGGALFVFNFNSIPYSLKCCICLPPERKCSLFVVVHKCLQVCASLNQLIKNTEGHN